MGDCRRCRLASGRKTIVFGQGNPHAELMFVGEAPGAEEDEQGLAFVGRAGQLLTDIIEKGLKMRRADVWIANILKCRPPQNRNPEPDEILACQPFLEAQIRAIRPRVLVGLGKFGAHWLLKTAEPITRLRGRVGEYEGIPVMPTYHPAYLLRNPAGKKDVWEDMKVVLRLLGRPVPGELRPSSRRSGPRLSPPASRVTPVDAGLVSVALPVPFQAPFTYRMPAGVPVPERGVRVQVPFGSRRMIGVVVGAATEAEGRALKEVAQVLDESPLVEPALLDLAAWMADHYLAPPGECYRLVLPPAGVRASRAVVRLAKPGEGTDDPVLRHLQDGPLRLSALGKRLGRDPQGSVLRLRRAGLVELEQAIDAPGLPRGARGGAGGAAGRPARPRAGGGPGAGCGPPAGGRAWPTSSAIARRCGARSIAWPRRARCASSTSATCGSPEGCRRARRKPSCRPRTRRRPSRPSSAAVEGRGFRPFLLHGVTGSGKTEVYFRAVEAALARGRGAIVLVPEIGLTPMLVRAARSRFGPTVSVLHSELSAGERHDQWWRIREGDARVVVGARSAVFAPVPDLGLVVVDEEHDGSYKQDESPRYHGRDVAVMRARLEGCPVVLGSATPSVESHANALRGKYERLLLPRRIGPQGLPRVEIVDRREVLRAGGDPILSPALRDALAARLARREQSLVLLNRRGYATSLLCRECGQEAMCPNCSVTLTLHQGGRSALCHYCGHEAKAPTACPSCRGAYLRLTGFGTERVAEAVQAALPAARVDRLDRDRARRRGALAQVLAAFEKGEIDVLVGTQMIAKGHDFPNVTLVGVVDADVGLGIPDFRSAERTFQLLTQVAGRAGPGRGGGRGDPADPHARPLRPRPRVRAGLRLVLRARDGVPPHDGLPAGRRARERDRAGDGRGEGRGARPTPSVARCGPRPAGGYRVLGPAHAPLARLRNEHRFQVLLKGHRPAMRDAVQGRPRRPLRPPALAGRGRGRRSRSR